MKTHTQYFIGIEITARHSLVHVLDRRGKTSWTGQVDHNDSSVFAILFTTLAAPCRVTIKASGNNHDDLATTLGRFKHVEGVTIADNDALLQSCIKRFNDDRLNAFRLAELLRLELTTQTADAGQADAIQQHRRSTISASSQRGLVAKLVKRIDQLEERITILTRGQRLQDSLNH